MAIRKNLTLPSNAVVSYHRIAGFFIKDAERVCEIHLESYRDEDTRRSVIEAGEQAGAPRWVPMARPVVRIDGPLFVALFGAGVPEYPTKADLYAYLKTEPGFAGAVDV